MQIHSFGNDICKPRTEVLQDNRSVQVCFLGWIVSLVVSRSIYMCVLNQRIINEQRNDIHIFVNL